MAIAPIRHTNESFAGAPPVATGELNDPHSLAIHALASGACVLDVGCGSGALARRLVERGCRAFGVEIDPPAAEAAKSHCERVVVGDAEALDWEHAFPSIRFDAILFLDVLEHLREPARVLRRIQRLLTADGWVIASIPNVAHGAVRLQLLEGRFRYAESGLLDHGHLRFFDAEAVERLFADAGYQISQRVRIERGLAETEIPVDLETVPEEVLRSLEEDPEALTYQFFVIAAPLSAAAPQVPLDPERNLIEAHRAQVRELVRLVREGEAYKKKIEGELGRKEEHIGRLEQSLRQHEEKAAYTSKVEEELVRKDEYLGHLETELRERVVELEAAHEERACLERELLIRNEYIGELRTEMANAEGRLRDREAEIQVLDAAKREAAALSVDLSAAHERMAWLEDVVQQPRHFLSDRVSSWIKHRVPRVHRLLRPFVLALWYRWKE